MGVACKAGDHLGMATPPPGFWQKRLQAIENKGGDTQKERQEVARVSE
jgi:hypothetical protein